MIDTSEFKKGLCIEFEGVPYQIVEFQHVKPGKGNSFTRTRMKNLLNKNVLEKTFKSGEKVGEPDLEKKQMQYLYKDGNGFQFMDLTSFEQTLLETDSIGDQKDYLIENLEIEVLYYKGVMALIDEVSIRVQGGNGGDGCVSFRREAFIPFGGPNGGDGGRGGHVYLKATRDKTSLLDFKYQPKYQGKRGEHGLGKDMFGRGGEDMIIAVPPGTTVYDEETGEVVADLVDHEQTILIAKGGKGGKGNLSFKTSTNRAPRTALPGELGEVKKLKLELKLIADVGLVGLPNAGKSSFLSAVSRARPKVANYPFTTLEPCLGVVGHKDQGFVVADLPGLIEHASEGVGLGYQFLKHVTRNRILLHLVDLSAETEDIIKNVDIIRKELGQYDPELLTREEILVFTKSDLLDASDLDEKLSQLKEAGYEGFAISSAARQGIDPLLDKVIGILKPGLIM